MIELTVRKVSKDHAYITFPDGLNIVTVNNLKYVDCVKKALEDYLNAEAQSKTVAKGTNEFQRRTQGA